MGLYHSTIIPKNSSADLLSIHSQKSFQSIPKLTRQSSVLSTKQRRNQYIANQHQKIFQINNDFLVQPTSSFSVRILIDTMNSFFEATQSMEEEIMLPSRLKDIPVDNLAFDSTIQPDSWYELYSFIRNMRNQLQCIHTFAEDYDHNNSKEYPGKNVSDDERIIISDHDNVPFPSVSYDKYERSSTSSDATYDTLKNDLKYHYYGLVRSLDNLTLIANRVKEKYREEYVFQTIY